MSNSRRKGAKAERVASKVISKWTGKGFSKTPASGGLNWKKSFVAGDVVCTTEGHFCPFCFEVKSYSKIDFSHLINPKIKDPEILDFWAQAKRDAEKVNKIPMLMMRYNGLPKEFYFVVLDMVAFTIITTSFPLEIGVTSLKYNSNQKQSLIIIPSTDFFTLPYKGVRLIAKKLIRKRYGKKEK